MFRRSPVARRWGLGVALSLAAHALVGGGVLALFFLRGFSFNRAAVDVEITGMRMDEVHDLPLGAPPAGAAPEPARARHKARRRTPKAPAEPAGELASAEPGSEDQAGAREADEDPPPAPKNLRGYGPEGSRLTVLLRLDRLRATPYLQAVDAILRRLPAHHDLLEGTGVDLYKSFDALLIATPNPLDDSVTFLAARHHLKDADVRALLEAGARATGRLLTWRTERHRPVAERHASHPGAGGGRDDRLLILPAPGVLVVTPPVYRAMLLAPRPPRAAADGGAGDGGPGGGDAGGASGGEREGWGELLRRLDAEDGVLPANAIAMFSGVDLFSARSLQRGLESVQGARAPRLTGPAAPPAKGVTGTFMGMEVPKVLTVVVGAEPSPFLDLTAELADEAQARHWEESWPALHRQLRLNPYLVLSGLAGVIAGTELTREGANIHLHQTASELETMRLLELIATLMGG